VVLQRMRRAPALPHGCPGLGCERGGTATEEVRRSAYRAGTTRKVPGRKGMVWQGENWVDEEDSSHKAQDDC